jgi:SEC-C motif
MKIGRNDPCPCGSGKKHKKCCGKTPQWNVRLASGPPPPEAAAIIAAQMHEVQSRAIAEQAWKAQYGHVRPCISMDFHGRKFVAAGGRLYYSGDKRPWKYVLDFLIDYIPTLFGKDWFMAEVAKQPAERHPLFQWRVDGANYLNAHNQAQPDGSYAALPNGALAAYASFALNLFAIEDNSRLDEFLLERLKNRDQSQGARQEVFAEAICLRAGFSIERENEKDRTKRHAEFTARHKATGQLLSVEAKSRHRSGILGQPGLAQPHEKLSLRFGGLLNDAIAKNPAHPLVVFIDTNLPYKAAERVLGRHPLDPYRLSNIMTALLDRDRKEHGGVDRYAVLVFTNHPHHYVATDELDPQRHVVGVMPDPPKVEHPQALRELLRAVDLYGNIPKDFPQ